MMCYCVLFSSVEDPAWRHQFYSLATSGLAGLMHDALSAACHHNECAERSTAPQTRCDAVNVTPRPKRAVTDGAKYRMHPQASSVHFA
jgi:hypothetical protein